MPEIDSLEALRRRHPLPAAPPVPADWRPGMMAGLFGAGKPWGDCAQARLLILHGKIPEARALLDRLLGKSPDLQTQLTFLLETQRPPVDEKFCKPLRVIPSLPEAERHAADALIAYVTLNYEWLGEAILKATARAPASELGAFIMLAGFVGSCDLWVQTQILLPRKKEMSSAINIAPFKALALFLQRRHEESWQVFRSGLANPETTIASYTKSLGVTLTSAENEKLTSALKVYCEVGMGLVLFDLGFDAERREHFGRLVSQVQGGLADACRLLAKVPPG